MLWLVSKLLQAEVFPRACPNAGYYSVHLYGFFGLNRTAPFFL